MLCTDCIICATMLEYNNFNTFMFIMSHYIIYYIAILEVTKCFKWLLFGFDLHSFFREANILLELKILSAFSPAELIFFLKHYTKC